MRQRTRFRSLALASLALLVATIGIAKAAQEYGYAPSKFIVAGSKAYGFFGSVKFVCAPTVVQAQWSSDGNYLLLERHESRTTKNEMLRGIAEGHPNPPSPSIGALLFWNRSLDRMTEVLRFDPRPTRVFLLRWVPGTTVALVSIVETVQVPGTRTFRPRQSILELDAKTSTKRVLASADGEGSMNFWVSPAQAYALLMGMDGTGADATEVYRLYQPGKPLVPIVPPKDRIAIGWSPNGASLVLARAVKDALGKRTTEYSVLEVMTGVISPYPNPGDLLNGRLKREAFVDFDRDLEPGQLTKDLCFRPSFGRADPGQQREAVLVPAKLGPITKDTKGKTPALLVTREAEYAAISPNQDAVVYITRGMAMMRELIDIDGAEYEKVERADAMDRAKQVALGMIMYATDYDDRAVPNDENWQDCIDPYLKNRSVYEGFNYTFGGGLLTDVQDPAKTELGYVAVTGGRVVAFVDGHVEFQPNKGEAEAALLRRWASRR
ncbi:MAG: hypothetical protein HZC36_12950 [Armatimonadetes bacterium]|nr:hypothetical protein [Armatimonadota bacterium]